MRHQRNEGTRDESISRRDLYLGQGPKIIEMGTTCAVN